jgi:hypothetical protein
MTRAAAGFPPDAFEEIPELRAMKDAAIIRTPRKPDGWSICPAGCNRRGRVLHLLTAYEP